MPQDVIHDLSSIAYEDVEEAMREVEGGQVPCWVADLLSPEPFNKVAEANVGDTACDGDNPDVMEEPENAPLPDEAIHIAAEELHAPSAHSKARNSKSDPRQPAWDSAMLRNQDEQTVVLEHIGQQLSTAVSKFSDMTDAIQSTARSSCQEIAQIHEAVGDLATNACALLAGVEDISASIHALNKNLSSIASSAKVQSEAFMLIARGMHEQTSAIVSLTTETKALVAAVRETIQSRANNATVHTVPQATMEAPPEHDDDKGEPDKVSQPGIETHTTDTSADADTIPTRQLRPRHVGLLKPKAKK